MTKTIKYIGYYDILRDGKQVRGYSLAGAKKMDYLCSVLNNIGYDVEILSPATKSVRGVGFSKSERLILKDGTNYIAIRDIGDALGFNISAKGNVPVLTKK